jgi:hypothetical protein
MKFGPDKVTVTEGHALLRQHLASIVADAHRLQKESRHSILQGLFEALRQKAQVAQVASTDLE